MWKNVRGKAVYMIPKAVEKVFGGLGKPAPNKCYIPGLGPDFPHWKSGELCTLCHTVGIETSWCLLSPCNSVGGDIVLQLFMCGLVRLCVHCFCNALLCWHDTDYKSLSNFTCKLLMMRGETLLILGHGVISQGKIINPDYKTLWA